jgi:hypothetical protein
MALVLSVYGVMFLILGIILMMSLGKVTMKVVNPSTRVQVDARIRRHREYGAKYHEIGERYYVRG